MVMSGSLVFFFNVMIVGFLLSSIYTRGDQKKFKH